MPEKMRVLSICSQVLADFGWELIDSTAIAKMEIKTAVGMREAFVYLSDSDGYNFCLQGHYLSEGRNILEPRGVLIPTNSNDAAIKNYATEFCSLAYSAIQDSYARRLFVKYG